MLARFDGGCAAKLKISECCRLSLNRSLPPKHSDGLSEKNCRRSESRSPLVAVVGIGFGGSCCVRDMTSVSISRITGGRRFC